MAVLVTGGARSGKSAFAEAYCSRVAASGIYIATCKPYDAEMEARTAMHKAQRAEGGFPWDTVEEPFEVARLLDRYAESRRAAGSAPPVLLVDCLTLWLSNMLLAFDDSEAAGVHPAAGRPKGIASLEQAADELVEAVKRYPYPLVLVTNEVGGGIVPAYPLGRRFRDEAGRLNRRIADVCARVFLVTAGIPVELKSAAFRWEDL